MLLVSVAYSTTTYDNVDYITLTSDTEEPTPTSSTSQSPTLIWVTTTSRGNAATIQVTFTQSFTSFYTTVETPPAGSVGLGTIRGTVGNIRTYRTVS